jgi:hypothetical protein
MRARPDRIGRFPSLLVVVSLLASATACSSSSGTVPLGDIPDPVFSDPVAKIALTGDADGFSRTLYDQYVYQDTGLVDSAQPVAIHMAFFGGPNNRGRALSFLDTTNFYGSTGWDGYPRAKAIWIMGNGDWQYAAYRLANESERWSDRARQEDRPGQPIGNTFTLHGQIYVDPYPVTSAQANEIWANYSAAYAGLSKLFHGNGRAVHARAFVQGVSRTSAFWTECRTIRRLMAEGHIVDFLCAGTDFPSYRVTTAPDWVECPATCDPPP